MSKVTELGIIDGKDEGAMTPRTSEASSVQGHNIRSSDMIDRMILPVSSMI